MLRISLIMCLNNNILEGFGVRKLILLIVIAFSSFAYADRITNNFRTSSGDIIEIGDTEASLLNKMGQAEPKFYVLNDGRLYCAATEYVYTVNTQQYKVIACRGRIVKIEWRNL